MASILLLKSAIPFLTTEKTLASLKPLNIIFGMLIMYFSPLGSSCITNVFEEQLICSVSSGLEMFFLSMLTTPSSEVCVG